MIVKFQVALGRRIAAVGALASKPQRSTILSAARAELILPWCDEEYRNKYVRRRRNSPREPPQIPGIMSILSYLFGGDEKRFERAAAAEEARAEETVRTVSAALQPLEAALGALRGDVGKIDLDFLLREWSFFNALLERMRTELASSPFRAPARAVLRTARQSTELLQSLKPTLNELDGYMMSVWASSTIVDGMRDLLGDLEAQLAKPKLERRPSFGRRLLGRGGEQRTRQRLQSVADDLSQLLGALQQLAIHPQTRQLQTTLQQAHESLEGAERSLAKLPSLLAILLQHLLRGDATEADAAIARVRPPGDHPPRGG